MRINKSSHAADVGVAADNAGIVAIADCAVIVAHHSANILTPGNITGVIAVDDGAPVAARHAANEIAALQTGTHNTDIHHGTTKIDIAEQAHIAHRCIIEIQPGNAFAVSVKGACV